MKTKFLKEYFSTHTGENRSNIRYAKKIGKRKRKNYFALSNEIIEMYHNREISGVDVKVFSFLSSLKRKQNAVCASQKRIALACGITAKTVSQSIDRLLQCGLIVGIYPGPASRFKYKKNIYIYSLKPLPNSGFFFAMRNIFMLTTLTHKMFAMYLFMCKSQSFEFGKSWNSYNDISERLGFSKGQRSEVVKLIQALANLGLIKKTVRKIKKVFVDNIYRVVGLEEIAISNIDKKEKCPDYSEAQFSFNVFAKKAKTLSTNIIVSHFNKDVNPMYQQLSIVVDNL